MRDKKYVLFGLYVCFFILGFAIPVKGISSTTKVEPYADSNVKAYQPIDNFGSSDYLEIGADLWGYQQETYIKFLIPTIETEILRVYIDTYWYSFMCETPLSVSACLVNNSWDEYTITWSNKPSHSTILDTDTYVADSEDFIIDVSLTHITQGSTLSICIYENTPYKPDGLQGNSREAGYYVPELVVEYETPPIETPPISPIVFIIIGVIAVGVVGGIVYSQKNKKKKIRQRLENSTYMKYIECSKCGNRQQAIDTIFCTECGQKLK